MSALKYRDRIRFEQLASPPGDPSDPAYDPGAEEWALVVEVWAEVQDVKPSRSEAVKNGIRLAQDSARVTIRHRPGLTSAMRIVELTGARRTLSIIGGPAALGGYRELEFMVERFSS